MDLKQRYENRHDNYAQLCAVMRGHAESVNDFNLKTSKDIMDIFLSYVKPLDLSAEVHDFFGFYTKALAEWKQSYQG